MIFSVLYIVLGVVLLIVAAALILGRDNLLTKVLGPVERAPIVFSELVLPDTPNRHLACPENYCAAPADAISPAFKFSVSELQTRWQNVVELAVENLRRCR